MNNTFTVSAIVHTTKSLAWEKWTNPIHVVNWNFASDDWCCPTASNDLTVGGKFQSRMESKDGSMGFDFEGTYTAVKEKEHIAYILADQRTIDVSFEECAEGVKVTEIVTPETENPVEMQQAGWQAILNNFKLYAERE